MKRILYCLFLLFLSLPLVAQEYTQLTNLPTVYIETKNKAAVTSKKDFVNATWKMVDGDQVVTLTDMKIRCRGNSTFSGSNDRAVGRRADRFRRERCLDTHIIRDHRHISACIGNPASVHPRLSARHIEGIACVGECIKLPVFICLPLVRKALFVTFDDGL